MITKRFLLSIAILMSVTSPSHDGFSKTKTLSQFDEDGRMKVSCFDGSELFYRESDTPGEPARICWRVGKQENCQQSEHEAMTGLVGVSLTCDKKSAEVLLPVSNNYPVFFQYKFEMRNQKIVFLGSKQVTESTENGANNFDIGLSALKVGKFKEGFSALQSTNDDGCMNNGCRPTEDLARSQSLDLVKRVGVEVGKIAQKFDQKTDLKKIISLYEGYFQFTLDLGLIQGGLEKTLITKVAKNALKDLEQPLNDWAFYLWKTKSYSDAQTLLESVLRLNPERSVAYLNLGDVLWDSDKKKEAKIAYAEYAKRVDQKKWPKSLKSRHR